MKKIIAFITVVFLILNMFGTVYAEDAVEETVSTEVHEALEETEQETTETVEERDDTTTEIETENTETDEQFSDVDKKHWAYEYINKAQNINIINGYGDSTFKPENTVTYNEFIKMLVCVTGYADKAEKMGGYPDGYIAVAEETGITEGIVFEGDDEVTRNDVGIMILNVLNILK